MVNINLELIEKAKLLGGIVEHVAVKRPEHLLDVWEHEGFNCAMIKGFLGCNGYVQLPKEFHSKRLLDDDIRVDVHGGLTYGMDESGWVGFDTGHSSDVWMDPDVGDFEFDTTMTKLKLKSHKLKYDLKDYSTVWTTEKLKKEINDLAEQLAVFVKNYDGFESKYTPKENLDRIRAKMVQLSDYVEQGMSYSEAAKKVFEDDDE